MAELRIKKIGEVTLKYPLLVVELNEPNDVLTEFMMSVNGVHIVWNTQILTPYRTLISGENGWIGRAERDTLIAMYKELEATLLIEYTDGSTEKVRFAHEKKIKFTPLYEGAEEYVATINMAIAL